MFKLLFDEIKYHYYQVNNIPKFVDDGFLSLIKEDEKFSLITSASLEKFEKKSGPYFSFFLAGKYSRPRKTVLTKIANLLEERGIGSIVISSFKSEYLLIDCQLYNKVIDVFNELNWKLIRK